MLVSPRFEGVPSHRLLNSWQSLWQACCLEAACECRPAFSVGSILANIALWGEQALLLCVGLT